MISRDGFVKVMDFGLAILLTNQNIEQNLINPPVTNSTKSSLISSMSTVQGTAFYMAPEQIEKRLVDSRTDTFALGVVLYEMAYGKRPFRGETFVEIMEAILSEQPPFDIQKSHRITKDLSNIILKALSKNTDQRFQSAKDFANALKQTNSYQKYTSHQKIEKKVRVPLIVLFIILLLIMSWLASKIVIHNSANNSLKLFSNMRTIPLTNWAGLEEQPAFSPDGKQIAFQSDHSGNLDIWLRELTTAQFINLTENSRFNEDSPCWSPDVKTIAFVSDRDGGGIYTIDFNTREHRKVTNSGKQPSWSPDGKCIAFITDSEKEICILTLNNGKINTFFKIKDDDYLHAPKWSPDGKWLSFTKGTGFSWDVWIKSTVDNKICEVTHDKYMNYSPEWHPQKIGLYFYSDRSGIMDIWFKKIELRKMTSLDNPFPVTKGAGVTSYDISLDEKKIAYATVHNQGNIHALALKDSDFYKKGEIRKVTNWNRFTLDPAISPGGNKILMTSNIQGNFDLWICDRDGKNPGIIHRAHDLNESPVWGSDGNCILFVDGESADRELKILNLMNGQETFLTNNDFAEAYPDWSPEGKWIAYTVKDSDCNIWIISPTGEQRIQLTNQTSI